MTQKRLAGMRGTAMQSTNSRHRPHHAAAASSCFMFSPSIPVCLGTVSAGLSAAAPLGYRGATKLR